MWNIILEIYNIAGLHYAGFASSRFRAKYQHISV